MAIGVLWGQRGAGLKEAHTLICHVLVLHPHPKVSFPVTRGNCGNSLVQHQSHVYLCMHILVAVNVCGFLPGNIIMYK